MLALGHISGEDVGVDVSLRGEGEGFQDVLEAARGAAGGEAEEFGALGDEVHADRCRFAVGDRFVIVAAAALDGSADGVSEVEETALFLAGGVDFYIVRLDGNAAADDFRQHAQELHVGIGFFEKLEELFVTDAAELHGFAHAIMQVFSGECLGHAGIDIDGARLIEGADEILARGDVERDLAADGAPDLREHGCRELDIGDAAVVGGSDEAGDVTDDASAERDEDAVGGQTKIDERTVDAVHDGEASRFLTRGDDDHLCADAGGFEGFHKIHAIEAIDPILCDDGCVMRASEGRDRISGAADEPAVDHDVVGILAEVDMYLFHKEASFSEIRVSLNIL